MHSPHREAFTSMFLEKKVLSRTFKENLFVETKYFKFFQKSRGKTHLCALKY